MSVFPCGNNQKQAENVGIIKRDVTFHTAKSLGHFSCASDNVTMEADEQKRRSVESQDFLSFILH